MISDFCTTVSLFNGVSPLPKVGDKVYENGFFLGVVIDINENTVILLKRGRIVNPANFEEIIEIPFEQQKICSAIWNVHFSYNSWSFQECQ